MILTLAFAGDGIAQDAEYDFPRIFGECEGCVYVAQTDRLRLRVAPDLDAQTRTVSYRVGWAVPIDGSVTRVIRSGRLQAVKAISLPARCAGGDTLQALAEVSYLLYLGEGSVGLLSRVASAP